MRLQWVNVINTDKVRFSPSICYQGGRAMVPTKQAYQYQCLNTYIFIIEVILFVRATKRHAIHFTLRICNRLINRLHRHTLVVFQYRRKENG